MSLLYILSNNSIVPFPTIGTNKYSTFVPVNILVGTANVYLWGVLLLGGVFSWVGSVRRGGLLLGGLLLGVCSWGGIPACTEADPPYGQNDRHV